MLLTDNNPLVYLQTAKLEALEQRWACLNKYKLKIRYRPGHSNRNADALSQYQMGEPTGANDKEKEED